MLPRIQECINPSNIILRDNRMRTTHTSKISSTSVYKKKKTYRNKNSDRYDVYMYYLCVWSCVIINRTNIVFEFYCTHFFFNELRHIT